MVVIAPVRLYRDGLEDVLARQDGIDVIGTTATPEQAVAVLAGAGSCVVLLDAPAASAVATVRRLRALGTGIRVVAVAIQDEEADVAAWARAGASGFVSRDNTLEHLVGSVRSAARGELHCSPSIAAALLGRLGRAAEHASAADPRLTRREHEVVRLIEEGLSNKEIARALNISVATVKNHLQHVYDKLGVHGRRHALDELGSADARLAAAPAD